MPGGTNCAVPSCSYHNKRRFKLSMFSVQRPDLARSEGEKEHRKLLANFLLSLRGAKAEDRIRLMLHKESASICEQHFLPSDIIINGKSKRLKQGAMPYLNLPVRYFPPDDSVKQEPAAKQQESSLKVTKSSERPQLQADIQIPTTDVTKLLWVNRTKRGKAAPEDNLTLTTPQKRPAKQCAKRIATSEIYLCAATKRKRIRNELTDQGTREEVSKATRLSSTTKQKSRTNKPYTKSPLVRKSKRPHKQPTVHAIASKGNLHSAKQHRKNNKKRLPTCSSNARVSSASAKLHRQPSYQAKARKVRPPSARECRKPWKYRVDETVRADITMSSINDLKKFTRTLSPDLKDRWIFYEHKNALFAELREEDILVPKIRIQFDSRAKVSKAWMFGWVVAKEKLKFPKSSTLPEILRHLEMYSLCIGIQTNSKDLKIHPILSWNGKCIIEKIIKRSPTCHIIVPYHENNCNISCKACLKYQKKEGIQKDVTVYNEEVVLKPNSGLETLCKVVECYTKRNLLNNLS